MVETGQADLIWKKVECPQPRRFSAKHCRPNRFDIRQRKDKTKKKRINSGKEIKKDREERNYFMTSDGTTF